MMKTRGWIDFYLPSRIAYHLKIVLASILITIFFNMMWAGQPYNENFWLMFISLIIQLEIFMLLAFRVFSKGSIKTGDQYKKQIIFKLIKFYLLVLAIATVFLIFTIAIQMSRYDQEFSDIFHQFIQNDLLRFLVSWLIGISIGSLVFFYQEWNSSLKRERKLREEKLIFQYETLKNQVNPHFLFNSLNTLSSLVSQDPQLSEKFISTLSGIYRYIIENRDVELINLAEEIAFVERFFFLQKIRDNGKIELQMDVPDVKQYEILPISIQLLVENALKHNAATKQEPLIINLGIKDGYIVVENKLTPKMHLEPSSNLGLKNLKERVKLILNKEVLVDASNGKFVVKIPLKSI